MLYTIFFSFCRLQPLYSMCVFEGAGSKTKDPLGIGGLLYSRCNMTFSSDKTTRPHNRPHTSNQRTQLLQLHRSDTSKTRKLQYSVVVTVATSKSNWGFCSKKIRKTLICYLIIVYKLNLHNCTTC